MKCFFNLIGPHEVIVDDRGVEAGDLDEAHREAMAAIDELCLEDPQHRRDWAGWRLEIVGRGGMVLEIVTLGEDPRGVQRPPNAISSVDWRRR